MVRDSLTGKYRRTRLFVMTLGYSRKSVLVELKLIASVDMLFGGQPSRNPWVGS